jgi:hypothetical protein
VKAALRSSPSSHPDTKLLALYASADLPLLTRLRVRHHIWRCAACEEQVAQFRSASAELRREAKTSTLTDCEAALDWARLEREMLGNIAVGVAAARCIENVGRRRMLSRGALVTAGLVVLFVAGWFTHIPPEQNRHLAATLRRITGLGEAQPSGTIIESTPNGIAVRTQGATLTLMHPSSAVVSLAGSSASGSSAVTARYLDEDTGQVTITKVYGQ